MAQPQKGEPSSPRTFREKQNLGKIRILIAWNLRGNRGSERLDHTPKITVNSGRASLDASRPQNGFYCTRWYYCMALGWPWGFLCSLHPPSNMSLCLYWESGTLFPVGVCESAGVAMWSLVPPGCRFSVSMVTGVCSVHYHSGGSITDYPVQTLCSPEPCHRLSLSASILHDNTKTQSEWNRLKVKWQELFTLWRTNPSFSVTSTQLCCRQSVQAGRGCMRTQV